MGVLRSDLITHSSLEPTGSVLFDGNSDYLSWSNTSIKLGTSDFTLEAWINITADTGQHQTIFMAGDSSDAGEMVFQVITTLSGGAIGSGAARELGCRIAAGEAYSGFQITYGEWTHVACVRDGGTMTFFVNGVKGNSTAETENLTTAFTQVGARVNGGYNGYFNGYISNARIVLGALYKNSFTPSKFELENVPGTLLLCCQSSTSATTAAVIPSAITAQGTAAASAVAPDIRKDITDIGPVFADGAVLDTLSYMVPPGGTTAQSNRGRGVVLGGGRSGSPTKINTISYLEIPSTGISNDFGDLTESVIIAGCCASSTRGVRGGGYNTPTNSDTIDYVTIATTSNATDFGNLTQARHWVMGGGSQTRGIFGGGNAGASPNPNTNVIDYITIASEGNAADFGDLINSYTPTIGSGNAAASPTRLLFAGGSQDVPAPATVQNVIQYVTIASTGDATDFGDLTDNKVRFGVCSSSTRALYGGAGGSDAAKTNSITYVTIATTGNTVDFGDRTVGVNNVAATSNSLRGVFIGGLGSPTSENHIDYVTIATTGNAADWGDSFYVLEHTSACSDSHGGIS